MEKVDVCDMCYNRCDLLRRYDKYGDVEVVSDCCQTGLFLMPKVIYDFYKPEIDRILAGRHPLTVGRTGVRRLEIIENAWETYINTEDFDE